MDERSVRIEKVERLRQRGTNPYPHRFDRSHNIQTARALWTTGSEDDREVTLAGRLIAIRRMGKASFAHLEDQDGRIQLHLSKDRTEDYDCFKDLVDRGDIIGVTGSLFLTKTEELTVSVANFTILSKSIQPLPEKYHGLRDLELMRRQRYRHLIVDPDARQLFKKRSRMVSLIRNFLEERGFLDVQTPVLQPIYGGAEARPFITHHNDLHRDLYLRISPELYLKRLIVGGFDKVYELGSVFRNEGIDSSHNPEFSLLELYWAYADYTDMMTLTEQLVCHLANEINGGLVLPEREIGGESIQVDLSKPWQRLPFHEAIKLYTGIESASIDSQAQANKVASQIGLDITALQDGSQEAIIAEIFDKRVEPNLINPTFITDYPAALCPLTKQHRTTATLAERFEPFIAGMELGNAFSELSDPSYQADQFGAQRERALRGDDEAHPVDEDYINALEHGLPPTGGLGIGIDRLMMLLTGATSIRDVILFPLQRRLPSEVQAPAENIEE
ncbi:lysine--tRNA ligase [Dehalococcoidia bacterium]|nr:lysine--tRNA ligase [Dehalococcoidia bacterium]